MRRVDRAGLCRVVEAAVQEDSFTGVVSVFCGGETWYNQGFGLRDVPNGLGNNPETRFGIASGTKVFTALAIGSLIDSKMLSLETRVGTIDRAFCGFIDPDATILHLLTHNSGMYDYLDEGLVLDCNDVHVEIPWYQLSTPSEYLPLFADRRMKGQAGQGWSYSNGGYVLLGMIIERLSQGLYRDFVTENVLHPAGMVDSGFFAFNDLPANTANGYLADGHTTNIYQIPIRGGGDGGMYTTTDDLHRFWHALVENKILSPSLSATFLTTQVMLGEGKGYGCGIYIDSKNQTYAVVGGDAGVGFFSAYFYQRDLVVNVLSNRTDGEEAVCDAIMQYLYALPEDDRQDNPNH